MMSVFIRFWGSIRIQKKKKKKKEERKRVFNHSDLSGGLSNVEGWWRIVFEFIMSTIHFVPSSISSQRKNKQRFSHFEWKYFFRKLILFTSPVKRAYPDSNLNFLIIRHCCCVVATFRGKSRSEKKRMKRREKKKKAKITSLSSRHV